VVGYDIPQRLPADLKRLAILRGRGTDYLDALGTSHESGDIQRDLWSRNRDVFAVQR
jgi:hypothetical protein